MAHPDANIIFGAVIDDNMGDEVRVTVIAAGFERWEEGAADLEVRRPGVDDLRHARAGRHLRRRHGSEEELDLGDDDFDVPSFLR